MPHNKRIKTANYRHCEISGHGHGDPRHHLQELLEEATKKVRRPWIRAVGNGGNQSQFLTHTATREKTFCGTLVLCEGDKMIPLVDNEEDGSTWEGVIEPKDNKGKRRKLEEQAIFFAVRENHVAVIQTKELTISDLQIFFSWLIQTKAGLAKGVDISLLNIPSRAALGRLKDSRVRGIKIGKKAVWLGKEAEAEKQPGKRRRIVRTLKTDKGMLNLLLDLTKDNALIEKLKACDDPGTIYVSVDISYRSKTEKEGQDLIRQLAATFGDMPELSPEIRLDGDGKIKGEELTVRGPVEIQCPDGNLSKDDAMSKIVVWLRQTIRSGKVA